MYLVYKYIIKIGLLMTLGELYDKISSWPEETMNFCIEDVFSWRGVYAEPCCELSTNYSTKQYNLDKLRELTTEVFYGWKGGEYTYTFEDKINFESEHGNYSSGNYLKAFIKRNKDSEIVKHIFG